MLRWITFGLVVTGLAIGISIGFPYLTGSDKNAATLFPDEPKEGPKGPPPKIALDGEPKHDFGTMVQWDKGSKDFIVKNEGEGDLVIWRGPSTCSCTIANLDGADPETGKLTLKPGKSTPVRVTWETKDFSKFSRIVSIETNDPKTPRVEFRVDGMIYPAVSTMPPEKSLNFLTVNNSKAVKYPVFVFSKDREDLKITEVKASNPAIIETKVTPISPEDCKKLSIAKGNRVEVMVKEGADLGPFNEEILIKTDHPKMSEIKINAFGRVEGPISFAPERVRMREVISKKGESQTLTVWVRGKVDTEFKIEKKPREVEVAITPAAASEADTAPGVAIPADAKAKKYELKVTVPAGTPAGAISDEIVLKTNHPRAAVVKIPINVFINSNG